MIATLICYMCVYLQSEQPSSVSSADSSKKLGEHAGEFQLHNADVDISYLLLGTSNVVTKMVS